MYIVWFAPRPIPTPIDRNKYPRSRGSFIGVLNLTIDKAPTKPKDNAKELLTIVITKTVVVVIKGNNSEILFEASNTLEYLS